MNLDDLFVMNFTQAGKPIRYGAAVLPYCGSAGGWLLPVGPKQTNRVVKGQTDAMIYAQRLNALIQSNPQKALRLTKAG